MKERNLDYLESELNRKRLFFVKDHATALLCWRKAFDERLITENSTIFHIDKHNDFCFEEKNKKLSKKLLELPPERLKGFVSSLCRDNAEFIVNAMYSGIIKDGISVSCNDGSDYGTFVKGSYETTNKLQFESDGIEHNYYLHESQNISYLFGYQALIDDTCIHQDTTELFNKSNSFILDIDLDFFTYENDMTFSKNPKDIEIQINSPSFKKLLDKSNIITIALEPEVCGGVDQCINILEMFDKFIFKPYDLDISSEIKEKFLRKDSNNDS